jgi:hypothetical protein
MRPLSKLKLDCGKCLAELWQSKGIFCLNVFSDCFIIFKVVPKN